MDNIMDIDVLPDPVDIMDSTAQEIDQETAQETAQDTTNDPEYNVLTSCNEVARHMKSTGCPLDGLKFVFPTQIVDGSILSFTSGGKKVAEGRLRFKNHVSVDNASGAIYLTVTVSDLSYGNMMLDINIDNNSL